jgi:hypothetical protein
MRWVCAVASPAWTSSTIMSIVDRFHAPSPPVTRAGREADKGRELLGANYRPRDPGEALDAALAAFMPVIEDWG